MNERELPLQLFKLWREFLHVKKSMYRMKRRNKVKKHSMK